MKVNFIVPGIGNSGGINVINRYIKMMQSDSDIDVIAYANIKGNNMHRYSGFVNRLHQVYMTIKALLYVVLNNTGNVHWVWDISGKHIRKADATIATTWVSAYKVSKLPQKCGRKFYFIQDFEVWDNSYYGVKSYQLPLRKIVISTWINKKLFEALGIGPFPIVFNGLDTTRFNNPSKKINDGNLTFLMLNHTLFKKGVKNGLDVFNYFHKKYPKYNFKMFGMCSSENLPNYVEYHQNPSPGELLKLYQDSDIFIYPSLEEGWGLTPIEAMACKCAVVGTNTGFVLDIGKDKINMMISRPGDNDEMIKNVEYLIKYRSELKAISETGNKAVQKFNWNYSYNRLLKVLENYNEENK